ncbi:MAG: cupredoxin domain-containing protein [Actinomycetota bacterium]
MSRRIAIVLMLLAGVACGARASQTASRAGAPATSSRGAVSHENAMIQDPMGRTAEPVKEEVDHLVIKENRFVPQPFAVAQDYGLIIVNEDRVTHNVTIVGAGTPLSVNIAPGDTYDSVEQLHRPAGYYVMYDKLHPALRGTMAVSLRMMIVERRGY